MSKLFDKSDPDGLDVLIAKVTEELEACDTDAEHYPVLLSYLERLNKLKAEKKPKKMSRDTMAVVGGNLLGVLIIVAYESAHVITTKALGTLIRAKLDN